MSLLTSRCGSWGVKGLDTVTPLPPLEAPLPVFDETVPEVAASGDGRLAASGEVTAPGDGEAAVVFGEPIGVFGDERLFWLLVRESDDEVTLVLGRFRMRTIASRSASCSSKVFTL